MDCNPTTPGVAAVSLFMPVSDCLRLASVSLCLAHCLALSPYISLPVCHCLPVTLSHQVQWSAIVHILSPLSEPFDQTLQAVQRSSQTHGLQVIGVCVESELTPSFIATTCALVQKFRSEFAAVEAHIAKFRGGDLTDMLITLMANPTCIRGKTECVVLQGQDGAMILVQEVTCS